MSGWYLAPALVKLRAEVRAFRPGTQVDTIGDEKHQNRVSDHNPDRYGCVRAIDVHTNAGIDGHAFVGRILHDRRVKYVIHDRTIWRAYPKPGLPARTPAHYDGINPHATHVHVSVWPDSRADDASTWNISESNDLEDEMTPELAQALNALGNAIVATNNNVVKLAAKIDAVDKEWKEWGRARLGYSFHVLGVLDHTTWDRDALDAIPTIAERVRDGTAS